MKHRICILTALLCLTLLASVGLFPLSATAAEASIDPTYQSNQAAAEALTLEIFALKNQYDARATALGHPARSQQVSRLLLTDYYPQIGLILSRDAQDHVALPLDEDFALLKAKAVLDAKLTWIAYAHGVIPTDEHGEPTDPKNSLSHLRLTAYRQTISRFGQASEITAAYAESLCIEMNRTVFKEKLYALPRSYELPEHRVQAVLQDALTALDACDGYDGYAPTPSLSREDCLLDGVAFAAICQRAEAALALERLRLDAEREYETVYRLLGLPQGGFSQDAAELARLLQNAATGEAVNQTLLDAACRLLDRALPDNGKQYVPHYRQALCKAFRSAAENAGGQYVASFSPFLDGRDDAASPYPFLRYAPCARAKDAVWEETDDPMLRALIDEYVGRNGILEGCESETALAFEVSRASLRKALCRTYRDHEEQIERIAPSSEVASLMLSLRECYRAADSRLCLVLLDESNPKVAVEACARIETAARAEMADRVRTAEAYRFLCQHDPILKDEEITPCDEDRRRLNAAIADLEALPPQTQEKLADAQRLLNEKYKVLICTDIRDGNEDGRYDTEDALASLRREALDKLCELVRAQSSEHTPPSILKAVADDALMRADALLHLLRQYGNVLNTPHYPQYDEDAQDSLYRVLEDALRVLTDPTESASNTWEEVAQEAALTLARYAAVAELRLAACGSTAESVQQTLNRATEELLAEDDPDELLRLRDAAVFHIVSLRLGDTLRDSVDTLAQELNALPALTEEEREVLRSELDGLLAIVERIEGFAAPEKAGARDEAEKAFLQSYQALRARAISQSLEAAKRQAANRVAEEAERIEQMLASYTYISDKTRDEHRATVRRLLTEFDTALTSMATHEELDDRRDLLLGTLAELRYAAEEDEKEACRNHAYGEWESRYALPDAYSPTSYESIRALLFDGRTALEETAQISDMLHIRKRILDALSEIPTRLDEAKRDALERLSTIFHALWADADCYSQDAQNRLRQIYDHAVAELQQLQAPSLPEVAARIADEKGALMQGVRRDCIYTESYADSQDYPAEHDGERDGLYGSLSASDGIPYDGRFHASLSEASHAESAYQRRLQKGLLTTADGGLADRALYDTLRDSYLVSGLSLTYSETPTGLYTVTLLLPAHMRQEPLLGVVAIGEDGSLRFFDCELDNGRLRFRSDTLTDLYIVAQKPLDLWLFIALLTLLLCGEAIAIGILLALRMRRRSRAAVCAWLPYASSVATARKTLPEGGLGILIALSVLCVIGGGILLWLIVEAVSESRAKRADIATLTDSNENEPPEDIAENTAEDIAVAEPTAKVEDEAPEETHASPAPTPNDVTVEEADRQLGDEEAKQRIQTKETVLHAPIGKKAEINIDLISRHFRAGETVSLETLKERGLLGRGANAVKILARGSLDKPLTVVANDFSVAAVKMILLTGGEAILIERVKPSDSPS